MGAEELDGKVVSVEQALELARGLVVREGEGYRCNHCGKLFSRIIGNYCILVYLIMITWYLYFRLHSVIFLWFVKG